MDKPDVLFTPEQIAARIRQIGNEVARDFQGKEVCVVGLIKSCMIFMADLVRAIPLDMTCHFLRVSSLREGTAGSTRTDIVFRERMRPVDAGSMPPKVPSELWGRQLRAPLISPGSSGPSLMAVSGRSPLSKAAR